MKPSNIIAIKEFMPYIIVGGTATLVDWLTFSLLTIKLDVTYQIALIFAYAAGSVVHYIANKFVTFKCRSKQIGSQISIYVFVVTISLGLSLGIMEILLKLTALPKVPARIFTTIIMLLLNYLLHKHITFSKKIFSHAA